MDAGAGGVSNIDEIKERIGDRRVIASVSGGKDSAAMSLWLHENGIEHDRVFCDTGWEHADTYEYLRGPLTEAIGPIVEIRGDLLMPDLVRKKGSFPSRVRRFCTEELKIKPLQRYIAARQDDIGEVINAVGIRAGESRARSKMTEWEWSNGFDCETWRPLIRWTEQDVIDIHTRHGLAPNPLYLRGARRVGCWPCVMSSKAEIRMIADTDPERIALLAELERDVSDIASKKRGETAARSFFTTDKRASGEGQVPTPIASVVEWSRTAHGGRQFELFAPDEEPGCVRWGLCETPGADDDPKEAA